MDYLLFLSLDPRRLLTGCHFPLSAGSKVRLFILHSRHGFRSKFRSVWSTWIQSKQSVLPKGHPSLTTLAPVKATPPLPHYSTPALSPFQRVGNNQSIGTRPSDRLYQPELRDITAPATRISTGISILSLFPSQATGRSPSNSLVRQHLLSAVAIQSPWPDRGSAAWLPECVLDCVHMGFAHGIATFVPSASTFTHSPLTSLFPFPAPCLVEVKQSATFVLARPAAVVRIASGERRD